MASATRRFDYMVNMLKSAMLAVFLLVPQLAAAQTSPIGTCYVASENANPGLAFTLEVNGSVFGTTVGLDQVAQFTARFHDNSTMSVTANAAGEAAVKDALNCLLGQNVITLSGFFLNEMPAFQVRANAYQRDVEVYDLHGVTDPGDGNRYVKVTSQSTFNTAMLSLVDFGTFDGYHGLGVEITGCVDAGGCVNACLAECDGPDDPAGLTCKCSLGECVRDIGVGSGGATALVQTSSG